MKDKYLKASDAKLVSYQVNPIGVNEVSILMEVSGQVTELLLAGATAPKLKIGEDSSYPAGAQEFPFEYSAGDRVFVTFTYIDQFKTSANVKLKCKDN